MEGGATFQEGRSSSVWSKSLVDIESQQVHQEFGELFAMKIPIFAQEIVSVLTTPFILWFSLPSCAPAIVDFFHDFTVWIPGRGYICSFAEFDFKRHGNVRVRQSFNVVVYAC
jgi:autophagy-related protein 9